MEKMRAELLSFISLLQMSSKIMIFCMVFGVIFFVRSFNTKSQLTDDNYDFFFQLD